ncbi:bifunctional serine/threonine-protein kinase/formylglycine-generating enzyme family protein [Stigmatella aurantiaca]|uniref:bifunctional serine/threonine-protein kinase/formylglycine-generating enzyme family protein n=1 Tax=Stigmatella aurantiaca TaxID=41 RepID=UPI001FEA303B|nr:bifunctional serine/threonine-protein kinase/formylglycine-generating enzyme family protein [Stigmatella aurantiaca]
MTDELLAELIDGRLPPEELSRVHHHAEACADCHALLVTVVRGGVQPQELDEPPLEGPKTLEPEPFSELPEKAWVPPDTFDEFRLVQLLGRGAMGVVYLAHDTSLDRQVAVKFIASHQPNARALEHFRIEVRAIARVQHPNVVTAFRVGDVAGRPYLVSEYLAGQSLADMPLPMPWRRARVMGLGMARGLAAAHRQGVLHRDLKPANVFLTAEGEVKLLDFGLAELFDGKPGSGTPGTRTLAGTPRYMAPELFQGQLATPQSDLYSLGVVLYELCTGALPSPPRALRPKGNGPPEPLPADVPASAGAPSLPDRVPGIDLDFAALIERCLHLDPSERFASAEALRVELERLGPFQETDSLPDASPYQGLASFEAEHRALFFGRDTDIRAVLDRLRRHPLVLIAGDSGVGKSSLCRAGILPRVTQGALDDFLDFRPLTLTPGRQPLAVLAAMLAPVLHRTEAELMDRFTGTPGWLGAALRALAPDGHGVLVFVDQAEELVTLSEPAQALRFAELLNELALPSPGVRVLLTVRGDFLTRLGALPGMDSAIERSLYLLQRLKPAGIREAIVGPARSRGVSFESEALLQTLIDQTSQGAGSLPLLQFTLTELWERRDTARACITQASLEAMGGVVGALSRHADHVLSRLKPSEQHDVRRLLSRLITPEGTRGEQSEAELTEGSPEARATLQVLIEGRLLHARAADGGTHYEIAHEALISSWGTLRRWLNEDAAQRVLRQRLELASAEWERAQRSSDLLWRSRQLKESQAIDLLSLRDRERDFLQASRKAARRHRNSLILGTALLVLVLAGLYAVPRLLEHRTKLHAFQTLLAAAAVELQQGKTFAQRALTRREEAISLFDAPSSMKHLAEDKWEQVLEDSKQARLHLAASEQKLEDALELFYRHPEAHKRLIETTHERLVLAERFHERDERSRLTEKYKRLTSSDPLLKGALEVPAKLEIETIPSGAFVELAFAGSPSETPRRAPADPSEYRPLNRTPVSPLPLQAGTYHLRITGKGSPPVYVPLWLEREEHARIHLVLPTAVPQGYAYVPPGCFFMGSADIEDLRSFVESPPIYRKCLSHGFFIGRTEVTFGEWVEYLEAQRPNAPERQFLAKSRSNEGSTLSLRQLPDGQWQFSFQLFGGKALTARGNGKIQYPGREKNQAQSWRHLPLAGVAPEELQGYLAWLDRSGRVKGARLCTELEWTRAARGADDRRFPHGHKLKPTEANIDRTYGRKRDAYGPDEAGLHAASESPWGVRDMAGNVFEITQIEVGEAREFLLKGGAWYYPEASALIFTREAIPADHWDTRAGVRVCASLPAP